MLLKNIKQNIFNTDVLDILSQSVFNPTSDRVRSRAEKYANDSNVFVYGLEKEEKIVGVVVFNIKDSTLEILDIAVKTTEQRKGYGKEIIEALLSEFNITEIVAETDNDAIDFYLHTGFEIIETKHIYDTERYVCIKSIVSTVISHYDKLIDENNDPVHDPEPLKQYMDKWDGQDFIDKMELDNKKTVFEIGVGTGRLAVRVAPLCGEFYGVDISYKTIERAKENLAEFENVRLTCADFLSYEFSRTFDIVYSSLTFMHIENKQDGINKVAALLKDGGKFILSIDKNQDEYIECGTRKIKVYPDIPDEVKTYIANSGLLLLEQYETEFAHIFVTVKE